jgi:signal transduction histidine kinase
VLRNIISNAVKYLNVYAKHCYLEFKISITHTKAYITASDNGIGIDQAYLAKIFNMFFRASPTSNGSGLGLYIVKQAIEKLNGRIKVESKKGAGTTFSIELPNFNT